MAAAPGSSPTTEVRYCKMSNDLSENLFIMSCLGALIANIC